MLFLLFFIPFLSFGQYVEYSDPYVRNGSAYKLEGKVYILTIFISESHWDYNDKLKLYDEIYEAENWLVNQGKRYNKKLEFIGGQFGLNNTIILNQIPVGTASGNEPVNLVDIVLKKVGYNSVSKFSDWIIENTNSDNYLVLIIANKKGNGYAMSYPKGADKKYLVEGTILYKRDLKNSRLLSSEIAHEFLHLFGAWDLYETYRQPKDREDKAKELFPNDIMHRVSYDIDELKIDKLTAWLVGLSSFKEDWYDLFKPTD